MEEKVQLLQEKLKKVKKSKQFTESLYQNLFNLAKQLKEEEIDFKNQANQLISKIKQESSGTLMEEQVNAKIEQIYEDNDIDFCEQNEFTLYLQGQQEKIKQAIAIKRELKDINSDFTFDKEFAQNNQ